VIDSTFLLFSADPKFHADARVGVRVRNMKIYIHKWSHVLMNPSFKGEISYLIVLLPNFQIKTYWPQTYSCRFSRKKKYYLWPPRNRDSSTVTVSFDFFFFEVCTSYIHYFVYISFKFCMQIHAHRLWMIFSNLPWIRRTHFLKKNRRLHYNYILSAQPHLHAQDFILQNMCGALDFTTVLLFLQSGPYYRKDETWRQRPLQHNWRLWSSDLAHRWLNIFRGPTNQNSTPRTDHTSREPWTANKGKCICYIWYQ
jgi:hypothetical protein